jgi:hypothetical protein
MRERNEIIKDYAQFETGWSYNPTKVKVKKNILAKYTFPRDQKSQVQHSTYQYRCQMRSQGSFFAYFRSSFEAFSPQIKKRLLNSSFRASAQNFDHFFIYFDHFFIHFDVFFIQFDVLIHSF